MALPNPPGTRITEIPAYLIRQVSGAMRNVFGAGPRTPSSLPAPTPIDTSLPRAARQEMGRLGNIERRRIEPWMGPGTPPAAVAPRGDVAGRAWDYPVSFNVTTQPRAWEGLSFNVLRGLADGLDIVRLCIETRKNQLSGLTWDVVPRMRPGENVRNREDPRCHALIEFFRSPDRQNTWDAWLRHLVDDMLVTDAASLYIRRTVGGDVYAIEPMNGSEIELLLDKYGRTPRPPEPAFTQILKGVPAIHYSSDELLYFPRNRRPGHAYGCPPVQQIFTTINIALRREINKLAFWKEGNLPEALIGVPETWQPQQIKEMQALIDNLTRDPTQRRRAIFIPGGTNYQPTRPVQTLDPQQDEWFARVICYCFGLPPLPLVQQMNRNTSETSYDSALAEGLEPTIIWIKGVMDHIITKVFGYADIEFVLERKPDVEDAEVEQRNIALVQSGLKSIDEARAEMGLSPIGMGNAIFTPTGPIFLADIVKQHQAAQAQAAALPAPDAPPMLGHNGGPPLDGGTPPPQGPDAPPSPPAEPPVITNDNQLVREAIAAQIPPDLLAAVGLGPPVDAPKHAPPAHHHAPPSHATKHRSPRGGPPQVLQSLSHYERRAGKQNGSKGAAAKPSSQKARLAPGVDASKGERVAS